MIRSSYLASAALALSLALPAAALAQSNTTPSPSAGASPMSANAVPGSAEQRVDEHIRQLHAQLRITPAEQPQWDRFAEVMRENARAMDQEIAQRHQQFARMNALQNMQSYQKIAEAHAQDLQRLVPAFENLYKAMPDQQKRLTDQVFRENAEAGARRRMQTGSNTER
ncbi:MAG: Spy/CpxP family protein refolding chaperone [Alphaproteobacteria bacterium]|nr:Spy/CpxP family protein refolding chaperone [Alphaproteobacteria bacterium]